MLQVLPGWLLWRYDQKPNKDRLDKVLYYLDGSRRSGKQGSPEDRDRLASFEQVVDRLKGSKKYDGIGLAILPEWDMTAVDLDRCFADDGTRSELAQAVIDSGSYCERSPSGMGLRAFYLDRMLDVGKRGVAGVEVFCGNGFVTVTGNRIGSASDVIVMPKHLDSAIRTALRRVDLAHEAHLLALPTPQGSAAELAECLEAMQHLLSRDYWDWFEVALGLSEASDMTEAARVRREGWKTWSRERADGGDIDEDVELDRKWDEDVDAGGFLGRR